ncbi:MgtC/SapB family protein [Celeribacter sp.]|uniref:MgtC/SapB family protein n=1 Tax=Celeribacter sp. TaxID=1890673 RepID=UPI003A8F8DDA
MLEGLQGGFLDPFANVSLTDAAMRMFAAILLGGCIGLERERKGKSAGLRTNIMVSLAACLFTLIAFDLLSVPASEDDMIKLDPLRLIEAVTSGVAFLAAGLIFVDGGRARGLTTGAGMWLAGAVGLACGVGNVILAAMACAMAVTVLFGLGVLESRAMGDDHENSSEDD